MSLKSSNQKLGWNQSFHKVYLQILKVWASNQKWPELSPSNDESPTSGLWKKWLFAVRGDKADPRYESKKLIRRLNMFSPFRFFQRRFVFHLLRISMTPITFSIYAVCFGIWLCTYRYIPTPTFALIQLSVSFVAVAVRCLVRWHHDSKSILDWRLLASLYS